MTEVFKTPTKTYHRHRLPSGTLKEQCRLCGEEKGQLQKVFSSIGQAKRLEEKVKQCCGGVIIAIDDELSKAICKTCENFVNKITLFHERCKQVAQSNILVKKRCPKGSPHQKNSSCKRLKFAASNSAKNEDHESENMPCSQLIAMDSSSPFVCAKFLMHSCPNIVNEIKQLILSEIDSKADSLCARKRGCSVLYEKDYKTLATFSFESIFDEFSKNFPFVYQVMVVISKINKDKKEFIPKMCMVYSILMSSRWHELSSLKRVMTILIIEGGCSKKLQERLNKLGVCLSYSSRRTLLELLGCHFMDKTVDSLKKGAIFRGTGDNWDLRIKKDHMRRNAQNDDLHLFSSNLIQNRIDFTNLPNEKPIGKISELKTSSVLPNQSEWAHFASTCRVLISRVLIDHFPALKVFNDVYPKHIPHQYSNEMSKKSNLVTMPIIDGDEAKYQDCVKILRVYEKWIWQLYSKAELIAEEIPEINTSDLPPDQSARPGQPFAQILFSNNDPMKSNKIVFAGDQLTRVRFSGAKDLLHGAHTPTDRLEHCSPFKPVMWHTKASLLQYTYNLLYHSESVNEIGTLKYFREKLNRKNVTPSKVVDSYDGCEELFISLGKAYIVVAAMKIFGMTNLNDEPSDLPVNFSKACKKQKFEYFDAKMSNFVKQYVLQSDFDSSTSDDYVQNYGLITIFLTCLLLQMKDTAAEGDGFRNLINQKLLLVVFKSLNENSKYAAEMFVSIAQIECTLTRRLSEEFKWGFFFNWRGGAGNNIEDDLGQEICNSISKKIVKRIGANKSITTISRICKATNGIREVMDHFDKEISVDQGSSHHTTRESETDEKEMISDIIKLAPFDYNGPRQFNSFPEIKRAPQKYINIVELEKWIERRKREWSVTEVIEDE